MKPIKRKYEVTKDAITASFNANARAAYARGDTAGWNRGFRIGVALTSCAALVAVVATVIITMALS